MESLRPVRRNEAHAPLCLRLPFQSRLQRRFRNAPLAEQIFISDTLGQGETDEEDLAALKALLRKRGGVDFARARARALYDRALTYLGQLPPTAHRDLLAACAAYLISRDR